MRCIQRDKHKLSPGQLFVILWYEASQTDIVTAGFSLLICCLNSGGNTERYSGGANSPCCGVPSPASSCRFGDPRNQKLLERSEDSWNRPAANVSLQSCWSPVQCGWR